MNTTEPTPIAIPPTKPTNGVRMADTIAEMATTIADQDRRIAALEREVMGIRERSQGKEAA